MTQLKSCSKKLLIWLVIFSLAMSYIYGGFLPFSIKVSDAATSIAVNTRYLSNDTVNDYPIGSSMVKPIIKFQIYTDSIDNYLGTTTINFDNTNFNYATDLEYLGLATTSGVALYSSANEYFDYYDQVITLNTAPSEQINGTTTSLTFKSGYFDSPPPLVANGTSTFFVAIRTSGTPANGHRITATIPVSGIQTTDGNNGPSSDFRANSYLVDRTPPYISSVTYNTSNSVLVTYSEKMNSTSYYSGYYTVSDVAVAGASFVNEYTVRVDSYDTIIPGTTHINATANIRDLAGNGNASTSDIFVTGNPAKILISEFSSGYLGYGFVELYNSSSTSVNLANWKLQYSYPGIESWTDFATILTGSTTIAGYKYYLLAPNSYPEGKDCAYSSSSPSMMPSGGHIRLVDPAGNEIDKLGWGSAVSPEGAAAQALTAGTYSLERKALGNSTLSTMIYGGSDYYSGNGFDTNNNSLNFIQRSSPEPQNTSSNPEYAVSTGLSIQHTYVNYGTIGQPLHIFAQFGDTSVSPDQITAELHYMKGDGTPYDNATTSYSTIFGVYKANGFFMFTIPGADITSAGIYYYLKGVNIEKFKFMSGSPAADATNNEINVALHPFVTYGNTGGAYTISGTAMLSDNIDYSDTLVIVPGTEYYATTTASGTFSIGNMRPGNYNFIFLKNGYFDNSINNIYVNSNTDIGNITLYPGGGTGSSGDTVMPTVKWTGPQNYSTGMPYGVSDFQIKVSFSKDLDPDTFITDNVLLYKNTDLVSGYTVEYNPVRGTFLPSEISDPYLGVITPPAGGLEAGATYYVVINENVRDWTSNSISGNRSSGGYEFSFTTQGNTTISSYGTGTNIPPYVWDIKPSGGSYNQPINTKIALTFSQAMDPASISATGNIKMYTVSYSGYTEVKTAFANFSASLDNSGKIAIISPMANLAQNTKYRVAVTGAVKSASGIYMGAAGYDNSNFESYTSYFETGSVEDDTAPLIIGSWPSNNNSGIQVNPGSFNIQFNERLDPTTVNTNSIMLKIGNATVNSEIKYDSMGNSIYIMPKNVLTASTSYLIYVTASTTDMAGNPMASDQIINFTTTPSYDSDPPYIMYANADEYRLAITFSEPMNSAPITDAYNWPKSVLNPVNYYFKWGAPEDVITYGAGLDIANTSFGYDSLTNTVTLENIGLLDETTAGKDIYISMSTSTASDLSGNIILNGSTNTFQVPIQDSSETGGNLGPSTGGTTAYNMNTMMQAHASPMNQMAGQNTKYFIDIPTFKSIPDGGKIVLTFPLGFDVGGAKQDTTAYINNDINQYNSGIVKFATTTEVSGIGEANNDGVTVDSAARKITITIANAPTMASDYLHFDISGIVNTMIPKGYDTNGYTVDIKTMDNTGILLESISTMNFFIMPAGENILTVQVAGIQAGDVDGGVYRVNAYLGSPMTGPMQKQININPADGSGSVDFSGLSNGNYYLYTDSFVSFDDNITYIGTSTPEPFSINASSTKTLSFAKEDAGGNKAEITVNVAGTFGTDDIDIFASGPNGYKVKTFYDVGNGTSTKLYLADGTWYIGMGPAIPAGTISGQTVMPDWMPPMSVQVNITNNGTSIIDNSGTTTDKIINFAINPANKQVIGYVKDGSNNAIADAEVWAYQPGGTTGTGAHARTDTDGKFILKVSQNGSYKIGAYKTGLPSMPDRGITVKDQNGVNGDGNETADIYSDTGILFTDTSDATRFIIKIKRPSYTIYGKITDGTNPVAYASVWANQTNGYGTSNTMSDSAGNYILYVDNGAWNVNAYISGYGNAEAKTVVVNGSDVSQNLGPSTSGNYYMISGKVGVDTDGDYSKPESPFIYMPIRAVAFNEQGVYQGKEYQGTTDSMGNYNINVPAGIYRVDIWTPDYGELGVNNLNGNNTLDEAADDEFANNPAQIDARTTDVSNADIIVLQSAMRNIAINVSNANVNQEGYLRIEGVSSSTQPVPTGFKNYIRISDLSATSTLKLANGDYFFFLDVPGLGSYKPDSGSLDNLKKDVVVTGNRSVSFTLPSSGDLINISGTVSDGSPISGAWVWVNNPNTRFNYGMQTADDGTYSLNVPSGSGYNIGADKPGYITYATTGISVSTTTTMNMTLTQSNRTISGYIYADINGGTANSYDSGEAIPNGFVRAVTTDGTKHAYTPVDGTGHFTLGLVNGIWKVYGTADAYLETHYSSNVTVSDSNQNPTINIELDPNTNWSTKSKMTSITPSMGGSLDDTAASSTGVRLTFPPNALGTSNSAGSVNANRTSSVTTTNSSDPAFDSGVNITAQDNSGQTINNLNDYIDIEMVLYKADVDQAIANNGLTYDKLKKTVLSYWDSASNDWVSLATSRTAYYKPNLADTDWTLYNNTGTTTDQFEAFMNELSTGTITAADYKLVFSSKSNHLTIFAVIMPYVAAPAEAEEDNDNNNNGGGGGGGGGGSVTTYCTSVTYDTWGSCVSGWQYRNVLTRTPTGCTLTTAQESARKQACELASIATTTETTTNNQQTNNTQNTTTDNLYKSESEMIFRAEVTELMPAVGVTVRNHLGESLSRNTLKTKLKIDIDSLPLNQQYALTNFITYGSQSTAWLGWGERAGVLNSYRSAFGKLPSTAQDWQDIIKIGNGRWPNARSATSEAKSLKIFKNIYKRDAKRSNKNDDAAVIVIAYGLRPNKRNFNSEKAAILSFRAIYGYPPTGATDWDVVRAIAYSGAKR